MAQADEELIDRIAQDDMVRGYTIACGGFYGPQGRQLRIPLADPTQNEKVEAFEYDGRKICNFEMESSALAGLSSLLGHKAMTCCMVIANRYAQKIAIEVEQSIETDALYRCNKCACRREWLQTSTGSDAYECQGAMLFSLFSCLVVDISQRVEFVNHDVYVIASNTC